MNTPRILGVITLAIALSGCSPKTPDSITTTQENITGSCSEILTGKYTDSLEFWIKFVKNQYPSSDSSSYMALYQELQNLESDETIGYIAKPLREQYLQDPPEHIKDKHAWIIEQMQENLAKVIYEIGKHDKKVWEGFIDGIQLVCSRETA